MYIYIYVCTHMGLIHWKVPWPTEITCKERDPYTVIYQLCGKDSALSVLLWTGYETVNYPPDGFVVL